MVNPCTQTLKDILYTIYVVLASVVASFKCFASITSQDNRCRSRVYIKSVGIYRNNFSCKCSKFLPEI